MDLTPSQISRTAAQLYQDAPLGVRLFQTYRPYICPFESILPWIPEGGRILDVGCGAGLLLMVASQALPIEGWGVDTSESAIKTAIHVSQSLIARDAKRVPTFHCLARGAPLPEGRFDAVCMIDVLHHVPSRSQKGLMEQVCSRVASGGYLIYKDMSRFPRWRAVANRVHDLLVAHEWINFCPVGDIEQWCANWGLQLCHSAYLTCFWYGHELRVFRRESNA